MSSLIPSYEQLAAALPAVGSAPRYRSTLRQAIELCRARNTRSEVYATPSLHGDFASPLPWVSPSVTR